MKEYLLFDLDGTLTDPKLGITTCVQYALKAFGIEEPDLDKLEPFIGPPLRDSFMKYYGFTKEQAEEAVAKYRERFQDIGIFENEIYGGIPRMLKKLKEKGMHLAVASSKPQVFVERILEHFHIAQYFQVVVGSELDGKRENKAEVVGEALARLFGEKPVEADKVYMIGDRSFDVEGARALHVESVGVTYGYGSMEELKAARADYIVRSVEELENFLLRGTEEEPVKGLSFQRIWAILYSFLMFLLVRSVALYAMNYLLYQFAPSLSGAAADFLVLKDESGAMIGITGNTSTIMTALGFVAGAAAIFSTARELIQKTAQEGKLSHLTEEPMQSYFLMGATAVGAVLGLNLFFELTGITNKSAAYQAVVEDQYSAAFLVGIICYGVISPIAEELLFRGVIHNYLRRFLNLKTAILFSAAIFGLYHMNAVQGIYAFIMGCFIAYSYEYFGNFSAPVCIHIVSNVLSYCLSYTKVAVTGFVSWPVCIVFLAVSVISLHLLDKQKKIL